MSNQSAVGQAIPPPTLVKRFYGVCVTEQWETVTLVTRAGSEVEASENLHAGYAIHMVLEVRSEQEHQRMRQRSMHRSLMTAAQYA